MNQAMRDSNTLFTIRSVKTFHVSGIPLICTGSLVTPYPLVLNHEFFFSFVLEIGIGGYFLSLLPFSLTYLLMESQFFNLGVVK